MNSALEMMNFALIEAMRESTSRSQPSWISYLQSERDLSITGMYIQSRERSINHRHVYSKHREIYQSPACIHTYFFLLGWCRTFGSMAWSATTYLRLAIKRPCFQEAAIVFSGAIRHYLCVFNRKFRTTRHLYRNLNGSSGSPPLLCKT